MRLIERLLARGFDKSQVRKKLEVVDKAVGALFEEADGKLKKHENEESAVQQANYMKGIPFKFYGLSSPLLTQTFSATYDGQQPFQVHYALFEKMIKSEVMEHKLYAIRILEKQHKYLNSEILEHLRDVILEKHVMGWALCDTLAKPVRLACLHQGEKLDDQVMEWRFQKVSSEIRQDNTWLRRVSTVSFVLRAKHGNNKPNYAGFMDKLYELCLECLSYEERFNQLGVGWLLREMWLADPIGVEQFIRKNYDSFIREGLRYAIQKMPEEKRSELLKLNQPVPNKKTATRRKESKH